MAKKKGKPVKAGSSVEWSLKDNPTTFDRDLNEDTTTKDVGNYLGLYDWGGKIDSVKINAPADGTQSDNQAAAEAVSKTITPRGERSPLNIPMNWDH